MSEQKFTPAPWSQSHRICDEEGNYSTQVFSTETGETIATLAWAKMPPKKVVIDGKQKNLKFFLPIYFLRQKVYLQFIFILDFYSCNNL